MSVHSQTLFNHVCLETELGQESVMLLGRLFLEDTANIVSDLQMAVANRDSEQVRLLVHMLKGCCRSIVALSVEEFCETLEDAAVSNDWVSISVGVNALGPLFQQLRDQVTAYLKGEI